MPLLWSYLLRSYLRVFSLSVSGFIAILLVTRLKEIARFHALASTASKSILFTLYQIPHILPIAIPISCLISAILLFQNMSRTHELTAFRSSGVSLKLVFAPLFIASSFLAILNFYITSELATSSRQKSREMLFEETTVNPLILLQRQKLLKMDPSYVDMKIDSEGKKAKDLLFITKNQTSDRLSLLTAKKFWLEKETLHGQDVAIISNLDSEEGYDTLVVENQKSLSTHAPSVSKFMKHDRTRLNPSSLPLRMLLIRFQKKSSFPFKQISTPEILRRISLGIAALTFTFIGIAYGLEIKRNKSAKGILTVSFLAIFVFACYMLGKQIKAKILISCLSFIVPHILLIIAGLYTISKVQKGKA